MVKYPKKTNKFLCCFLHNKFKSGSIKIRLDRGTIFKNDWSLKFDVKIDKPLIKAYPYLEYCLVSRVHIFQNENNKLLSTDWVLIKAKTINYFEILKKEVGSDTGNKYLFESHSIKLKEICRHFRTFDTERTEVDFKLIFYLSRERFGMEHYLDEFPLYILENSKRKSQMQLLEQIGIGITRLTDLDHLCDNPNIIQLPYAFWDLSE